MKIILLILMCMSSFVVSAHKDDTSSAHLIDEKGMAYRFGQTVLVNKGETNYIQIHQIMYLLV